MGQYIDLFRSTINSFCLYNEEIEKFFLNNYINRIYYHSKEQFIDSYHASQNTIAYVNSGLFKMYATAMNGQEIFTGYLPCYSTMITLKTGGSLGKYMRSCGESTVYVADRSDYLRLLTSSEELTWHQLNEPYYRRNLNSLPLYESLNLSAREQTYIYILYLGLRLGTADELHPEMLTAAYPPALKEVANYCGIHPNNISRYYNELRNKGIISFSPKKLIIFDINQLEQEIEELKK